MSEASARQPYVSVSMFFKSRNSTCHASPVLFVSGSSATSMNFSPPSRKSTSDTAVAARDRTQKLTAALFAASDPARIVGPRNSGLPAPIPMGTAKGRPNLPFTDISAPPCASAVVKCTVNANVSGASSAPNSNCACHPSPPSLVLLADNDVMGERMALPAGALPEGTLPLGWNHLAGEVRYVPHCKLTVASASAALLGR
mmetsp:Transcript_3687/g.10680  ORF Transcript_3687/g.10680 Transcript_3687/m.10680 type:complete len:200 (-) Transcript_3687:4117-4716(-)